MKESFGLLLTKFFGEYLPCQKGVSENTMKSYRDTFVQLIEFMESEFGISCSRLEFKDFSMERIVNFLDYLEQTRQVSVSTRNQRLAAVHSFFKYIQKQDLSCYEMCKTILSIEFKKAPVPTISYLNIEETKFLFSIPDTRDKNEFRDLTIMALLYETGGRVQELIDLHLRNVTLGACPTVVLHGKGNKTRIVPIGKDVSIILKKYIRENQITCPEDILFTNKQHRKLTRAGIQYIINKYVDRGRTMDQNYFNKNITNHSFRHSKAMHLLEAGVNLIYIRDFLGHTSVTTTEVYAQANAEVKRKVIEQHGTELKATPVYSASEKENLLSWLKSNI